MMFEQHYLRKDSHYEEYISYWDIHIIHLQNVVHVVALGSNVTIAVSLPVQFPVLKAICCMRIFVGILLYLSERYANWSNLLATTV